MSCLERIALYSVKVSPHCWREASLRPLWALNGIRAFFGKKIEWYGAIKNSKMNGRGFYLVEANASQKQCELTAMAPNTSTFCYWINRICNSDIFKIIEKNQRGAIPRTVTFEGRSMVLF